MDNRMHQMVIVEIATKEELLKRELQRLALVRGYHEEKLNQSRKELSGRSALRPSNAIINLLSNHPEGLPMDIIIESVIDTTRSKTPSHTIKTIVLQMAKKRKLIKDVPETGKYPGDTWVFKLPYQQQKEIENET